MPGPSDPVSTGSADVRRCWRIAGDSEENARRKKANRGSGGGAVSDGVGKAADCPGCNILTAIQEQCRAEGLQQEQDACCLQDWLESPVPNARILLCPDTFVFYRHSLTLSNKAIQMLMRMDSLHILASTT